MRKYWFDADEKAHLICKMETEHIKKCLRWLETLKATWRNYTIEDLTEEEMKHKNNVGQLAWFLIHGADYEEVFLEELKERDEE